MSLIGRPKAEVVAKALEQIADDQYSVNEVEEGAEEITISVSEESCYEPLWEAMRELEKMHEENCDPANQLTLEEDWSDFWTFKLIELLFAPLDRENMSSILRGRTFEEVLLYLHDLFKFSLRTLQGMLGVGRETVWRSSLPVPIADLENWANLAEHLSTFYARRLSKQFPKIVNRAEKLLLLRTDYEVPNDVRRYIEEASKCYLYGQLIGCLMVCRSTIEFAVKDRLITLGYGAQLQVFEQSEKGDSLKYLIDSAQQLLPFNYGDVLRKAQDVRKVARIAVHVAPPNEKECREMFLLTRQIVHTLYAKP